MRRVEHVPGVYAYVGELPRGCRLCMRGEKLVVFITGVCSESCFYCPVSPQRLGRDVVYADEERARSLDDIVAEALRVGARGASITGGEPLERLERTLRVIRVLKRELGDEFHIHLYTSARLLTRRVAEELEAAGLDELRIHPVEERLWPRVEEAVEAGGGMSVGVEVPVFPGDLERLKPRLEWLEEIGADFVNLNEAEVAPHRLEAFLARGYRVKGYVVEGSYEEGLRIVEWAARNLKRLSVHLCPASYKDRVQHRNRLVRKAVRTRMFYEEPTEQGTLVHIEAPCTPRNKRLVEEGLGAEEGGVCLLHPSAAGGVEDGWVVETYPDIGRRLVSRVRVEAWLRSRGGWTRRSS